MPLFKIYPKSIEIVKICDDIAKNASVITPSIIEKEYDDKKYVVAFDSIIRECLVFDKNNNLIDGFATIFTDLKYNQKFFREYIQ